MDLEGVRKEIKGVEKRLAELEKERSRALERGEISDSISEEIEKKQRRLRDLHESESFLKKKDEDAQKKRRIEELEPELAELREQALAKLRLIAEARDNIRRDLDSWRDLRFRATPIRGELADLKGVSIHQIQDLPCIATLVIQPFLALHIRDIGEE